VEVVVQEWERVLVYMDGRFERVLGPGRHRVAARRRRVVPVLVRPRLLVVPLQEVLTADGLAVKVSLTVASRIAEPRRWFEAFADSDSVVYAALQVALREAVSARTLEGLLAARGTLAEDVRERAGSSAEAVGVDLDAVSLRDVVVPVELRRAAAELATARAQGQAALERARSEVAATRALANAARMVAEQPGLLQLRTLQAVEAGGATVVLTTSGAGDPRPIA
jgi:regulator of protease activity HflC (stomatin/prohibitin superfamily)